MVSGWVILDKDAGKSSRGVGNEVRKIFGADSFGHVGTLDPMASGVLPIAIGEATKMIPYLTESSKIYEFDVIFGIRTDTDDMKGRIIEEGGRVPSLAEIKAVLPRFVGKIMQVPPAFSAVHIDGRRAYQLALEGVSFEMPEREVEVFGLSAVGGFFVHPKPDEGFGVWTAEGCGSDGPIDSPEADSLPAKSLMAFGSQRGRQKSARGCAALKFKVECSKGTYVRSLARDIAAACGTIATVDMIRRLQSNGFLIGDAIKLEKLKGLVDNEPAESLKPIDYGLGGIPVFNLDNDQERVFRNGGFAKIDAGNFDDNQIFRVYSNDKFLGIGTLVDGVLRPKKVILS